MEPIETSMQPDYTQTIIADLVGAQWPMPLAERFAHNFPTLDPIFTPVLKRWCEDKTVLDITVYGCTLTQIIHARNEHFWVCIRNMNAIYTNTSLSDTQRQSLMQHHCDKPVYE